MKNKKIIESWGKIKPTDATDQRILSNIMKKQRKVNNMANSYWKILAPITACVLIGIFIAIPLITRSGNDYIPQQYEGEGGVNHPAEAIEQPSIDSTALPYPSFTYPIVLNEIENQFPAGRLFMNVFWNDLSSEETQLIFPGLGFPLAATAHYLYDGTLMDITAVEGTSRFDVVMFGEFHAHATIQVGNEGNITRGVLFYDLVPEVSYVHGVPVEAGIYRLRHDAGVAMFIAGFVLEGIEYSITLHDYEDDGSGLARLTHIVNEIIINGPADLGLIETPEIPELRSDEMTLAEALADQDFGGFLPGYIPGGLAFGDGRRVVNQYSNALFVNWHEPWVASLSWHVMKATDFHLERLVSAHDRHKFDLALFPTPWMESVPEELMPFVSSPVFLASEVSIEIVEARVLQSPDGGRDTWDSPRINFSILFGDVVVEINSSGLSVEDVWEMVSSVLG